MEKKTKKRLQDDKLELSLQVTQIILTALSLIVSVLIYFKD